MRKLRLLLFAPLLLPMAMQAQEEMDEFVSTQSSKGNSPQEMSEKLPGEKPKNLIYIYRE